MASFFVISGPRRRWLALPAWSIPTCSSKSKPTPISRSEPTANFTTKDTVGADIPEPRLACKGTRTWGTRPRSSSCPRNFPSQRRTIPLRRFLMMKMMRAVVFVMLAALCLAAQEKETTPQETTPQLKTFTVIRAGTLIDGKSDSPRRDQVIVIRGNRIDSVSDAASAKIPSGSTVIDLSRATVLPGLIDSHTHIFLQGEDPNER